MRHCVRRGPSLPQKGHSLQIFGPTYCGQTAKCIRVPLSTEVGLGSGDIVLDGEPAPLLKGAQPPIFGPCVLWHNSWMDQYDSWYEGGPRPGDIVLDGDPAPSPKRGTDPNFRPVCTVAKRLAVSRCHLTQW